MRGFDKRGLDLKRLDLKGLGATVARLAKMRKEWQAATDENGFSPLGQTAGGASEVALDEVDDFGSNPGNLRMFVHVPSNLPEGLFAAKPALVVVLHGCTQTAAGYAAGSGWVELADRHGFVVLLPEQQRENNANRCFNWFEKGDTERNSGEALSIKQMVDHAVAEHGIDPSRIFVTGLSAGGAMCSVMLAAYPETFAGGAIIAGLPYRTTGGVQEAFEHMFRGNSRNGAEWAKAVHAASSHKGPWPKISVWHGTLDRTVVPENGHQIAKQWAAVHALDEHPSFREQVGEHSRSVWRDDKGREWIEHFEVSGMAHGTPLAIKGETSAVGKAGPYFLDVGLHSSQRIAASWGLVPEGYAYREPIKAAPVLDGEVLTVGRDGTARRDEGRSGEGASSPRSRGIGETITSALRAAGLM